MDRLDAMRLFVRIVERSSFTKAASDTGVPRSTVTTVIQELEERLGVQLLHRTTRTVRPTLEGETYYRRCLSILAEVDEAEGEFNWAEPRGLVRVDVQGTCARHFLMPGLPDFFARYPFVELSISENDQWIDPVQEGVDCVLRYGRLPDSNLVGRTVATLERVTCAAPAYLERFGAPTCLEDLHRHRVVALRAPSTGKLVPLEFEINGVIRSIPPNAIISVSGSENKLFATQLGLGLSQLPVFHIEQDLAQGRLIRVLHDYPLPKNPLALLYLRTASFHLVSGRSSIGRWSNSRARRARARRRSAGPSASPTNSHRRFPRRDFQICDLGQSAMPRIFEPRIAHPTGVLHDFASRPCHS
jgi:DNA-binding transcriptional LysR family regulator